MAQDPMVSGPVRHRSPASDNISKIHSNAGTATREQTRTNNKTGKMSGSTPRASVASAIVPRFPSNAARASRLKPKDVFTVLPPFKKHSPTL